LPAWIFANSAGSAGSVSPAQSGEHRGNVIAVRRCTELGAQNQVDGIVAAVVAVQLGARRYQPHRCRPGLTGLAEANLPWQFSRVWA